MFGRMGLGRLGTLNPPAPRGGAALLQGETGLGIDFTDSSGVGSVAVIGHTTNYNNVSADTFLTQSGTSPKMVRNSSGTYVWTAHNLFVNSASPATQNVTLITGATYTYDIVGSGSLAGSSGASGTATEGSPVTFVATGTTGTFTLAAVKMVAHNLTRPDQFTFDNDASTKSVHGAN